jgi:hypothetical protein
MNRLLLPCGERESDLTLIAAIVDSRKGARDIRFVIARWVKDAAEQ